MFFNKDNQMFESDFDDNNFDNFSGMEPFGKKVPVGERFDDDSLSTTDSDFTATTIENVYSYDSDESSEDDLKGTLESEEVDVDLGCTEGNVSEKDSPLFENDLTASNDVNGTSDSNALFSNHNKVDSTDAAELNLPNDENAVSVSDESASLNESADGDNEVETNSINSDLIRGHIDTIILKALQDGDRYGYDIIKEIEQKSGGKYLIKQPTLYSCLKRLEVQGFVKSYWGSKSIGGRKKYFTLTDMGKELFLRNQHDWKYSRDVIDSLISDEDFGENEIVSDNDNNVADMSGETNPEALADDSIKSDELEVTQNNVDITRQSSDSASNENAVDENANINLDIIEQNNTVSSEDIENANLTETIVSQESENNVETNQNRDVNDVQNFVNENDDTEREVESESVNPDDDINVCDESSALIDSIYAQQQSDSYIKDVENAEYIPTEPISSNEYFNDSFYDYGDNVSESDCSIIERADVSDQNANSDGSGELNLSDDYNSAADETTIWRKKSDRSSENSQSNASNSEFFSYHETGASNNSEEIESIIEHEYSSVIASLIENNTISTSGSSANIRTEGYDFDDGSDTSNIVRYNESDNVSNDEAERIEKSDLGALREEIRESSGEKLAIRTHSDATIKKFNSKHYYYANRLRLLKNGILYAFMLIEICCCFYFIEVKHNSFNVTKFNLYMYIAAVILATSMPVYAFAKALADYYYRKRINFSPRNSVLFSIAVFILVSMIVFFLNVYAGLLVGEVNNYISTLILPIVLSTNFIVDAVTFNALYKSHSYSIED
ncbi:MAG: hypothetical protein BHW39_10965 [Firmicutes bacterium CAG:552_39_19]|nr:MAG: hypothetical protein BHW39_10965 [Firmicutes bacterium CAG:552_39_19]